MSLVRNSHFRDDATLWSRLPQVLFLIFAGNLLLRTVRAVAQTIFTDSRSPDIPRDMKGRKAAVSQTPDIKTHLREKIAVHLGHADNR